ncbi:MAG: hypothetical protein IPJ11_07485 [Gemmatimonadetes bacterium]|nr:hypothetical protein [Gemmatimonadota bacterium]
MTNVIVVAVTLGMALALPGAALAQDEPGKAPKALITEIERVFRTDSILRVYRPRSTDSILSRQVLTCPEVCGTECRPRTGEPLWLLHSIRIKDGQAAAASVVTIAANGSRLMRYLYFEFRKSAWVRVPPFDQIALLHCRPG